jgi:hypothetical protein
MARYYSPSLPGFLDDDIHSTIPEDAIEISPELHQTLVDGLAEGQPIHITDGVPTLGSVPAKVITWAQIRTKRDKLLAECDWTQLPDVTMSTGTLDAWREYRQALRDITELADPNDVVWPTKPA